MQVHLLSMPWGVKHLPSVQVGVLKAFLRQHLPDATVTGHHFHLTIPSEVFPEEYYWSVVARNFHEAYYLYLLAKKYSSTGLFPPAEELYDELSDHARKFNPRFQFLSRAELEKLGKETERQLDESIVGPSLSADKIVIGMTTNFHQTYANVFAHYYLREKLKDKDVVFVMGGASVSYPQVVETLTRLKVDSWAIIGEGEKKLVQFIQNFENSSELALHDEGVFHLSSPPDLVRWNPNWFRSQMKTIDELPDPDYDEYFFVVDKKFSGREEWAKLRRRIEIPMEGSRGCVFSCEFCNLNRFWDGYRKLPGEVIAKKAIGLCEKYNIKRVRFVDNLCDGWAKQFAETLVKENRQIRTMMELRPKHDESFWEVLRQSGLTETQIGIEGLDDDILSRVKKGTTVMDVVFTQKILTEKAIIRGSRQLISSYPLSTEDEVANTRRTLESMLHMPRIDIGRYLLEIDSPLYRSLSPEEQQNSHVKSGSASAMPRGRDDYSVYFSLEVPPRMQPTEKAQKDWSDIAVWYKTITPDYWIRHFLIVNGSTITDCRSGKAEKIILSTDAEKVYRECHKPKTLDQIGETSGLPKNIVEKIVRELEEKKYLLKSGGKFLSLALRMSEEEIMKLAGGNAMTILPARED